MSYENYNVIDCDGHIVESVPEMAEFMSLRIKQHATQPSRNHQRQAILADNAKSFLIYDRQIDRHQR